MSWNYRIGTQIFSYKKEFEGKNEELARRPDTRLFSVLEVYYDAEGNPSSYFKRVSFENLEAISDVNFIIDKVNAALNKPVLDLDNWPKEYLTEDLLETFYNDEGCYCGAQL